ncbi:MAG: N-acetylmuramic acid 6-phosphate etherase [Candidatus Nanopelagicaceae bacterium]
MDADKKLIAALRTEQVDESLANLDSLTPNELLKAINAADSEVPSAVFREIDDIEVALSGIVDRLKMGGRLIYLGAGTSGRLGVLDASECGPTFSVGSDLVIGLIAGGDVALRSPVEGAEDDEKGAIEQLTALKLNEKDVVVGIAASGRTPYVIGALKHARSLGSLTIALASNKKSKIGEVAELKIEIDSGPEVLSGSTRMKSGTAQKLVLNMLSTGAMILMGKTFGNLMVDLQVNNIKLRDRAHRIIASASGCDLGRASELLISSGEQVKVAILMELLGVGRGEAESALALADGRIRQALGRR